MIISLVHMEIRGGKGGDPASVNILVPIIGILFIVNSVRGDYVMIGQVL